MKLGAFSVSLSVKDIRLSFDFYSSLGFEKLDGDMDQRWLILRNGQTVIGLFEGMFDGNLLTFNPGWDQEGKNLDSFQDIRSIKEVLENKGLAILSPDLKTESGPGSFSVSDPDGNLILFDQHR